MKHSKSYNKRMPELDFADLRVRIQTAVNEKIQLLGITDPQGFTIVDSFVPVNLQPKIGGGQFLGGPYIPVVALVANSTGEVRYFALKNLLPDLDIW